MSQSLTIANQKIPEKLYSQVQRLSDEVRNDYRRKGVVLPTTTKHGIRLGRFFVYKNSKGFYTVCDFRKEIWYDDINLPQTAILIANDLELGRFVKTEILNADRLYGYALFEEQLHKRNADKYRSKDPDRSNVREVKQYRNTARKKQYKKDIERQYQKLANLI